MERLIIIEGPQGVGKSTLANYLRDTIPGSNLYRLSGQKDKSLSGLEYSRVMYDALMAYLNVMQNVPMDMIFDRMFTTEEVYGRLGYKEYSFTPDYEKYVYELSKLKYELHYFSLYLKNEQLYKQRLDRGEHHNYQEFRLENSINQQNTYLDIAREINKYESINVHKLSMDNFDESYDSIKKVLRMK